MAGSSGGSPRADVALSKMSRPRWLAVLQQKTGISDSDFKNGVVLTVFFLEIYAGLYLAIGSTMLPGGKVWTLFLVVAAAHVAGFFVNAVPFPKDIRMPALLGMLGIGMLLRNIGDDPVKNLPANWSQKIRLGCLAIIFLRSGLELNWKEFSKLKWVAGRLCIIPGVIEAIISGTIARPVFGMPPLLGYALGFILKAVGPAIVVQTMFDTQKKGLGVEKGIPSIVVAAASFDDMVALTGYSLFMALALAEKENLAWDVCHGILDLAFGLGGGLLGAVFVSCTAIWDTKMKRTLVCLLTGQVLTFFFGHWDFKSAGALANLMIGLIGSMFWERGWAPFGLTTGANGEYAHACEAGVGSVWKLVGQPLLFGIIGTAINFKRISTKVVSKAVLVIFSGFSLRIPTTFLVMSGAGLNWKERLFIAFAWSPKATVQAALAAAPLDLINSKKAGSPDFLEWQQWGEDILTTAVFAIILCGPLGIILLSVAAPYCLEKFTPKPPAEEPKNDVEPPKLLSDKKGAEVGGLPPSRDMKGKKALPDPVPITGDDATRKAVLLHAHHPDLSEPLAVLDSLVALSGSSQGCPISDQELASRLRDATTGLREKLLEKLEVTSGKPEDDMETPGHFFRAVHASNDAEEALKPVQVHVAQAS